MAMTDPASNHAHPLIALVGRPNVGKSTLFNRLIGARKAVVSPTRGTTRDRLFGELTWRGTRLTLMDTGGFEFGVTEGLEAAVQRHVRRAIAEADALLLVCDGMDGLVPADQLVTDELRRTGKPCLIAVNKLDHHLVPPPEFFTLGGAAPVPISALHGRGTGELLDQLVSCVAQPAISAGVVSDVAPSVAIVGRQNVGKSSLLNALVRQERVIVSERPGTTRDAVDTDLLAQGQPIRLIDTAGLRHRRKVRESVDIFSMSRSLEAIERCDVALMLLDATQGVTRDDKRIAARVWETGRGLIVVANKWDLMKGGREEAMASTVRRQLPNAAFAPVLAVSAKTGHHVPQVVTTMLRVLRVLRQGVSQPTCEAMAQQAWATPLVPRVHGRAIQLERVRWMPGRPAHLELVTRPIGQLPLPFQRHLLKTFYARPALLGVPFRLAVRRTRRAADRIETPS